MAYQQGAQKRNFSTIWQSGEYLNDYPSKRTSTVDQEQCTQNLVDVSGSSLHVKPEALPDFTGFIDKSYNTIQPVRISEAIFIACFH
jgi:hypothetical protein